MGEQPQTEMAFVKHQNNVQNNVPHHSPVAPSPSSKVNSSSIDSVKLRRLELFLRIVTFVSAVAGFAFVITDKQTRTFTIYTSVVIQEALYSDMEILIYTVIVLGVVAFYTASQIARCLLTSATSISPSSVISWGIFILDQIMTYLILSAAAGSAQSAYFSEQGNTGFKWSKVCYLYEKFCMQVGTGIVSAYIAFVALVVTSTLSAFNVFALAEVES